jgi:alpha-galactosidase
VADLDTHLRVTLFALPIFVGFGAQDADRSTDYFRTTRRYIELNKTFCRKIMADAPVVHHHTPGIGIYGQAERCVLEYAHRDRSRAYAGIFQLGDPGESRRAAGGADTAYVFHPRGLDPALVYQVRTDNDGQVFKASGRELARDGVRVLLDRPLTSELLLFDAVPSGRK